MALEYNTAKKRREPISFTIDGHEYVFTPPKLAGAVLDTMDNGDDGALLDWLGAGLSDEDEELIATRLRDPNDDLDIEDIGHIVQMLVEKVVGRPTKSRPGLRRPR
jgi:hypothetical protein